MWAVAGLQCDVHQVVPLLAMTTAVSVSALFPLPQRIRQGKGAYMESNYIGVATVFHTSCRNQCVGPRRGQHLRDFLDRVSLSHAAVLYTQCRPPPRITYIHARASVLYFVFISFAPSSFGGSLHISCTTPFHSYLDLTHHTTLARHSTSLPCTSSMNPSQKAPSRPFQNSSHPRLPRTHC